MPGWTLIAHHPFDALFGAAGGFTVAMLIELRFELPAVALLSLYLAWSLAGLAYGLFLTTRTARPLRERGVTVFSIVLVLIPVYVLDWLSRWF